MTIVLPEWTSILQQHAELSREANEKPLSICMMPRDISTWWNSMFDMIKFAVAYCEPLNDLTGCQAMKLQDYELTEDEWKIAEQLSGVLDVAPVLYIFWTINLHCYLDFQTSYSFFLWWNSKPFESNSCNGLHRQTSCNWLHQPKVFALDLSIYVDWKMAPQQVLQHNWSFRGIPNCHGYEYFPFFLNFCWCWYGL